MFLLIVRLLKCPSLLCPKHGVARLLYIRLLLVYGDFGRLNDLLKQAAFKIYMQLLLVWYLVFFVGYSLGFYLGATLHAYFAPWRSV